MSLDNKEPEIRLKKFAGYWLERNLNSVAEKIIQKNINKIYSETFTNSAEFGIISQRDYFDKDISNSDNIDGYYIVQPEDFVYNPRISRFAPCGPINRNSLGRIGIMSPLYTVFRIKIANEIFIEYFFQTKVWHKFMFLNGDTGARADRFSIKDSVFFELPLHIPEVNEQTAIGNYFQKLDTLINQHRQKHDKLCNIKKAMLEKMFPKPGETTPEIRFKGFSCEWEEKELKDICSYLTSSLTVNDAKTKGMYKLYDANKCIGYIDEYFQSTDYITIVKDGAGVGRVRLLPKKSSFIATMGAIKTEGSDLHFLYYCLIKVEFIKHVSGGAIPHIYFRDYGKEILRLPSFDEQSFIGKYFQKLDKLIDEHQQQISKLNNIKQACLSKMFV